MIFKLLPLDSDGVQIIARIDNDGLCRMTCTEQHPEYLAWLDAGNTPFPSDSVDELTTNQGA